MIRITSISFGQVFSPILLVLLFGFTSFLILEKWNDEVYTEKLQKKRNVRAWQYSYHHRIHAHTHTHTKGNKLTNKQRKVCVREQRNKWKTRANIKLLGQLLCKLIVGYSTHTPTQPHYMCVVCAFSNILSCCDSWIIIYTYYCDSIVCVYVFWVCMTQVCEWNLVSNHVCDYFFSALCCWLLLLLVVVGGCHSFIVLYILYVFFFFFFWWKLLNPIPLFFKQFFIQWKND